MISNSKSNQIELNNFLFPFLGFGPNETVPEMSQFFELGFLHNRAPPESA